MNFFSGFQDELTKLAGNVGKVKFDANGKMIGFKTTGYAPDKKPKSAPTPAPAPAPATATATASGPAPIKAPKAMQQGVKAVNRGLSMGSRQKGIGKYLP